MVAATALFAAPAVGDPLLIATNISAEADPTLAREVVMAVDDVAQQYPEVRGVEVVTKPLENGVYATAGNRQISFNLEYASNRRLFESTWAADVKADFHPDLGRCTPAVILAYHEAAHIIDQARDRAPQKALVALAQSGALAADELSGYSFHQNGHFNPGEALAEAFSSVRCNGGNDSERRIAALLS